MSKSLVLALLLTAGATSMAVSAIAADAPTTAKPVKKAKPKKICKDSAATTGSRIAKRICKTQDEWDNVDEGQDIGVKSKGVAGGN